jgi:hypothetical protein
MGTAEKLAIRVVNDNTELKNFDPMIVAIIVGIITAIFAAIKNCKASPEDGLKIVQNPNLWHYRKAKRIVRKHAPKFDMEVYEALKKMRDNVTLEEVKGLYEEC